MIQVREAARQTMANMAACPADTGSLFGGSPAQPAKGAVFGGKGRTADPSGAISKAKAKGDAPPKKRPPQAPTEGQQPSAASSGRSMAKARQMPLPSRPRLQCSTTAGQQPASQDHHRAITEAGPEIFGELRCR